jgi:hypothetical protein
MITTFNRGNSKPLARQTPDEVYFADKLRKAA